jgi:SAM-dependent methyltransferase
LDLVRLLDELKQRLEDRRRSGLYAEDLEERLDEHARQFAAHRLPRPDPLPPLRDAVAKVGEARDIRREEIEPSSSLPLGTQVHRAAERLQRRHLDSLIAQVWTFAATVTEALERTIDVLQQPNDQYASVLEQLSAILERIAALEAGGVKGGALGSLTERVERLEAAERDRQFRPFFSNVQFEEAFRGSQEELRESYASLADRLAEFEPLVDIGCGQGMLLELLAERGAPAVGVELDAELARVCRAKGLDVQERNGLEYLAERGDSTLGAIVLLQVVEHLSHQQVTDLFLLAHQKLTPGGLLAVETVNPQSLYVFARAFYLDPTHSTPVHPAYLEFLSREAGFAEHRIEWRNPVRPDEVLTEDTEDARRLSALLFGPQDYLFLGVR